MKRLTILLLLLSFNSFSQLSCVPYEQVTWINELQNQDANLTIHKTYSYYFTSGDTIIQNKSYQQLYSGAPGPTTYLGALRADTNTLYILEPFNSVELIVITFDVQLGDTLSNVYTIDGPIDFNVYGVTKDQNGRVTSVNLDNSNENIWVRDTGALNGMFINRPRAPLYTYDYFLYCASVNDTAFFPAYDPNGCRKDLSLQVKPKSATFTFHPNPAQSHIQLSHFDGVQSVVIFDVQGKMALNSPAKEILSTSELPEGIYTLCVNYVDGFSQFEKLNITR